MNHEGLYGQIRTVPQFVIGCCFCVLRNKSKVGKGFFEVGNFYPDYILWIDTSETQNISFIDPKGLMHIRADDPKIEFYKTIKELETYLLHGRRRADHAQFVHHVEYPLVRHAYVVG